MVRIAGLEPAHLAALPPQSSVSANSTICAQCAHNEAAGRGNRKAFSRPALNQCASQFLSGHLAGGLGKRRYEGGMRRDAAAITSGLLRAGLAQQLKNQSAIKVVHQLEEILAELPEGGSAEAVQKEVNYFHEHQDRMDHRAGRRRGEPIGSGAIESTCRQAQGRFKRPGQHWSQQGDESLLCLETCWRNGRWNLLFPHNRQLVPAKN